MRRAARKKASFPARRDLVVRIKIMGTKAMKSPICSIHKAPGGGTTPKNVAPCTMRLTTNPVSANTPSPRISLRSPLHSVRRGPRARPIPVGCQPLSTASHCTARKWGFKIRLPPQAQPLWAVGKAGLCADGGVGRSSSYSLPAAFPEPAVYKLSNDITRCFTRSHSARSSSFRKLA